MLTRRVGASLVVAQVDPLAEQRGLHAGMTLGEAQAVAPELSAFEHQPQRDRAALDRLANWALRFSPIVEPIEPDTLLLDITGCQRLFGGEANIATQARDGLLRQGFYARAAIADTVGAAYALATAGSDAVVIAPEGQSAAHLAPLPPAALRIDSPVVERLGALGVRTIGELLRLPRAALPARFGAQLVRRLQQALGEVYEEISAHVCVEAPAARIAFETPVRDLPALQAVAARLLEEVFEQVRQRTLALRRIDCVLVFEQAPPTVLTVGLSRASRAWRHVAELVRQRLEVVDLSPGVVSLRLVAGETARWQPGQMDLFEPQEPGGEEELGCLLDRLINRLGYGAVVQAELVDDYQPERAFRYVPVMGAGAGHSERSEESSVVRGAGRDSSIVRRSGLPRNDNGGHASPEPSRLLLWPKQVLPRPTQLLPRPLPIRVLALLPDGPPTWLAWRGREHVVARAWGPERIETGWWRGPDVRRDYFRVSSETGEQFWVFRSADDGRWYLHGIFV